MSTEIKTGKKLSNTRRATRILLFALAGGLIAKLIWTDHNTHDPGITTAEAPDYSISDLGYSEFDEDRKRYKRDG